MRIRLCLLLVCSALSCGKKENKEETSQLVAFMQTFEPMATAFDSAARSESCDRSAIAAAGPDHVSVLEIEGLRGYFRGETVAPTFPFRPNMVPLKPTSALTERENRALLPSLPMFRAEKKLVAVYRVDSYTAPVVVGSSPESAKGLEPGNVALTAVLFSFPGAAPLCTLHIRAENSELVKVTRGSSGFQGPVENLRQRADEKFRLELRAIAQGLD